ncbi:DUF4231 domain-containing protein [Amycolatopsis sp. NPDC059021]|uniref:DUF4231 domain-containing protein n=1 Tax=Amycolatopsis sp. NPDC059021 TaxID=3346704 RepID=UPI00366FA323
MTETRPAVGLGPMDYPGLFDAADRASLRGQRSFLRSLQLRMTATTVAAASAAFTVTVGRSFDAAAVVTALAFVTAIVVELSVRQSRPNVTWYEGRALSESVKTLAWRYAVGGTPCALSLSEAEADRVLLDRVQALQADLPSVPLLPTTRGVISDRMREIRAASRAERTSAYLTGRIQDQQRWYATKADYHRRRARILRGVVLLLEVTGVSAALAKAFALVSFDLAGIVAASVAGLSAWSQARQHTTAATAYTVASHELSVIRELLSREMSEAEWAATVADAEDAISREHTLWRASHGE